MFNDNIALLVDEQFGHYIPKRFAENYDLRLWKGIDPEDIKIIKNPEHEEYWDAWNNVLNKAYYEMNGKIYTLHHDENLYAMAVEEMTDEEIEKFFGKI